LLFLYRRAQRGASGTTNVLVSACAKKIAKIASLNGGHTHVSDSISGCKHFKFQRTWFYVFTKT